MIHLIHTSASIKSAARARAKSVIPILIILVAIRHYLLVHIK